MAELLPLLESLQTEIPPPSPSSSSSSPSSLQKAISDPCLQKAFLRLSCLLAEFPFQLQREKLQDQQEKFKDEEEDEAEEGVIESPQTAHDSRKEIIVIGSKMEVSSSSISKTSKTPDHHLSHLWTSSQFDAILDIAEVAISRYRHVQTEDGVTEPLEGVFRNTVELCVKASKNLKSSMKYSQSLSLSDEQVYNRLLLLMELAVDAEKAPDRPYICGDFSKEVLEGLDAGKIMDASFPKHIEKHPSPETIEISEDIILLLANDHPMEHGEPDFYKHSAGNTNMLSATQYFAISHPGFCRELIEFCVGLLGNFDSKYNDDVEKQVQIRLSMITRILRLLCSLVKINTKSSFSGMVLKGIVELAALVPRVLRLKFTLDSENVDNQNSCYVAFLGSIIALADIVCQGSCISPNLKVYLASAAIESLVMNDSLIDPKVPHTSGPVLLEPQVISYIFSLIRTVANLGGHYSSGNRDICNVIQGLTLQLWSQNFEVDSEKSQSEMIQSIFPGNVYWLPKLLEGLSLLYKMCMESRPSADRSVLAKKEDRNDGPSEILTGTSEDEALFGNLFSESSRQTLSNESHAQLSVAENKPGLRQNMTMQAVIDVLAFLKDYVFSLDCGEWLCLSAQRQMNEKGIDIILEIFMSNSNEKIDSLASGEETVSQVSFDALCRIVSAQVLSARLNQHLLSRVLENGYAGCTIPNKTLVLLAKVLISHSSRSRNDDSLALAFWDSFLDRMSSSFQKIDWMDSPLWKATGNLPSAFFIEVLLMTFHSSTRSTRMAIVERVKLILERICGDLQVERSCLCLYSLLFSRLLMVLRYMSMHFEAFPQWFLIDLKLNLSHCKEENGQKVESDGFPNMSIVRFLGQGLKDAGPASQLTIFNDRVLAYLFDINPFCSGDALSKEIFQSTSESFDLCGNIRVFLQRWKGKIVNEVEELLVERYVFLLGWLIVRDFGKQAPCTLPAINNYGANDLFGADMNLRLTQSLYSYFSQCKETNNERDISDWWRFFMNVLASFESFAQKNSNAKFVLVDSLRQVSVLNVILSFLQKGLEVFLVNQGIVSEPECEDSRVQVFCEQLVYNCISTGSLDSLLKVLLSVLSFFVNSFHCSVLEILSDNQVCKVSPSSIHLVIQGGLSWAKQDQIFTRLGVSFSPLHMLLRRGMPTSWLGEMMSKCAAFGKMGMLDKLFLPSLLQGYPCSYHPNSAMVMSCISLIEYVLETVEILLKVSLSLSGCIDNKWGENVLFTNLVDVLMMITLEEIFESIHHKCEDVLSVLLPSDEKRSSIQNMHLLKQKESLLKSLAGNNEISNAVREELTLHVVEVFSTIHSDPARSDVFSQHFTSGSGQLSYLIDALDGCHQETVNVKALQFLISVVENESITQGSLRCRFQEKLMTMDRPVLCSWLEQKLVGYTNKSADGSLVFTMSSNTIRELALRFLSGLVAFESTVNSQELHTHLLNALLLSLEQALNNLDNVGLRSYFSLLLQLANRESQCRQILQSVSFLMSKLPSQDGRVEGVKVLVIFLTSLLQLRGDQQSQSLPKVIENKHWHSINSPRDKIKHSVQKKSVEISCANQSGESVTGECDAASVDEDEDDGTSDGEMITSFDKEEVDDGSNSEKALASRVCTFTSSGNNFMEQHWYFCYTCDLTVSKGCCSVCARVCHKGHKVVYSRFSRFFCDCGEGSGRGQSCMCLKPRKYISSSSTASSVDQEPSSDSDSDLEEDEWADNEKLCKLSSSEDEEAKFLPVFIEMDIEGQVLSLCERLLHSLNSKKHSMAGVLAEIGLGEEKILSFKSEFLHCGRLYKSGSFDMKIKADYVNAKELKAQLLNGTMFKSVLSTNSRGKLAVGEGDKVSIFDVEQVIGKPSTAPVTVDKTAIKVLSKSHVRFELVHLVFNSANENYLAVAGYEDCQIFTVNPRGEVTDRLAVHLALQGAYIRRVIWIPGSQVQIMVVTNKFVKIYDLSQDNISPLHYFTVPENDIMDASLVSLGQERVVLVVLSQHGVIYSHRITTGASHGACILTNALTLPETFKTDRGISLHYSLALQLLFLSFSDGLSLAAHLDAEGTSFTDVSSIIEVDQDMKPNAAGLHNWRELTDIGQGLFISLSRQRSNSAVAVSIGPSEIQGQYIRVTGNLNSPRVDGVAAHRSLLKGKYDVLILHDDGSLQVFTYGPGSDASSCADATKEQRLEAEQVKRLGDAILGSRTGNPPAPVFPIDFFERTSCITNEIRLSGDILRSLDSEGAKLSLASEDGFLESPSPSGFKIIVHNPNADTVMVGCRVHVGNSSTSQIPSELQIFQRSIKLEEGVRRWYDLPFTNVEALLAEEEFSLFVGPTFGGFSAPRIDSLEVFGRSKDDFGWKEKLEAVLDMETHGSLPDKLGGGSKNKVMKSASTEEQVLADCLTLLCSYYLTIRMKSAGVSLEGSCKRCKPLLELVFESDMQPLLQGAARNCLRALYPARDSFYQAMDTLRLTGISRVCPLLVPKVRLGGSALPCLIQEFTALLRAACKIALHRRGNFVSFLESHGPSVIEDLMRLLWELLTVEHPDAETVNNLVLPSVDLIYGYAECLALCAYSVFRTSKSIAPAVELFKKLLFSPNEAVRASCSLAMSSRLLQVPFPRQTILTNDEVGDNSKPVSLPAENSPGTGGPDGQSMMEEDGGNASVQYCCDGCGTVPIVGRRWHCNVCPDFDLCEACYELMDGDRPPAPHSRDHPMSAIPIDVDNSGGADGARMHFASIDELSDENLPQVTNEVSTHPNSAHLSSTLDTTEMDESLAMPTETKNVAISASKRALNSLLLKSLVDECKGWTKCTSGTEALPLMQFFYRLASATTSPFLEVSDTECISLERFVRLLIEELNLETPLVVKPRSSFGEVVVIIFTFFNLMLRNWHQPGSDHSNSKLITKSDAAQLVPMSRTGSPHSEEVQAKGEAGSQLERACAALRQQLLLNYILSIVQQLIHVFKSRNQESYAVSSGGSVCGALLTVKKEFLAGNFAPYFTDSYAKAHRNDLFGEFHRLLLESAFRLAYNLVRPEKQIEKEQVNSKLWQDLNRDDWQEVLCSYINNPHTTSIRRFARRLLLHLCGSKGHYYHVRDAWQLSKEVKKLYKLVQKAGGFQALLVYERSVKLVKCLSAIVEVGTARPRNWQKYCSRHPDIIQFLLSGVFAFGEESVIQTLKLLSLAFYAGKELGTSSSKGESVEVVNATAINGAKQSSQITDIRKKKKGSSEDATDSTTEKPFLDMELVVEQFASDDGNIVLQFIDVFLLEWNAACVRAEAKSVLIGAWHHGRPLVREVILKKLLQKVPVLPSYGQNVTDYTDLLTWILGKGIAGSNATNDERNIVQLCLNIDVVKMIFDMLQSQNELLANHPNSRIYNTLSSLVEFDSYYLESEPCLACSCPEVPYSRMKLDSLKSETKFTDNRILVKCVGSHTIESVTMNVHDARRSKSVKVLNLYYNNKPVTDLSELKNNWSLWKRAKSCHLAFNQTELKVDFPIPITACNFMIELDSFYENLQASSLESLQCPRCSRYVTDKHGICGHCHENAYQCRQCRNINYENLDSFLCNECGYSKYGRFEFNFMAKPSFHFENLENDEDMKKVLAAIEVESENAHKRYQQLLGFKKPLLKLVSSIGETEIDSQQKDSVQQMIVSVPGSSSFKINRKIAILGVLYGEKCKMAFDSVSRSVQNLQGLRRILTSYLEQKRSPGMVATSSRLLPSRPVNHCYGCANTFVGQCLEWLQVLAKLPTCRQQLVSTGVVSELFENNIHQGSKKARTQARSVLCAVTEGDGAAVAELNMLIKQKSVYCLDHHRSVDVATCVRDELQLLSETCASIDDFWESRLRLVFELLFSSVKVGARHPVIAEHIILPCLRIISQACTPPKTEETAPESANAPAQQKSQSGTEETDDVAFTISRTNSTIVSKGSISAGKGNEEESRGHDAPLVSYEEWKHGATYVDFVRRQYTASQIAKPPSQKIRRDPRRADFLALKYLLRWKRLVCKRSLRSELSAFEESSWVRELALSACSPAIRVEMCGLIEVLCSESAARRSKFLNLLMTLLPSTRTAGEGACEYFELLFKMIELEDARLFLTVRGFLQTLCRVITEEVCHIESQEHTFHVDISQGYILHKLIELLGKFLQVSNIRVRFMKDGLLSQVLESLLVVRSLVVQKTKLISDCGHLLKELLDGLLEESFENKRHFVYACITGLQAHVKTRKDGTLMRYILELLCNIICPTKPEPTYMMVLNKAHTQEEFIRGSMTKNPYSSLEIGPFMRDVKNKICHQLDMVGLIEDDYGMELLVAGNIISLDLSVAQVYEQVWKKSQSPVGASAATGTSASGNTPLRECPPMAVTYRLQGLDGEATEPMIKELEDDREESQDPEVEFAIAGVMRECNGLDIVLNMVQALNDDDIKSGQEELTLLLKLLMYCCKIRGNRLALLQLGALGVLIERARRAFALDASETAEGLLLIVEYLVTEANESDIGMAKSSLNISEALEGSGGQAAYVVHMFLERLSSSSGLKKSTKQQRNNDTVARILPYLTYGEEEAMEILVKYFDPHLHDWETFDELHLEIASDEVLSHKAREHNLALENFCKVVESIKRDAQGDRLKGLIMKKGIITECIKHLKGVFSVFENGGEFKSTAEWSHALQKPSVPIILEILRGLSSGHFKTQMCLSEGGILPLLHALEGVSGDNKIGAKAENLLDALANKDGKGEGFLAEDVTRLRHATRDEMRKRALQKREELLQGLGMHQELTSGGERIIVSHPSIEGLEDVQEEEAGLACMVCREGYSLCPTDMLGTYCYSKRLNLGLGIGSGTQSEWVYTTVSHFNVIHFKCHLEAKRADASLKNPKKEWEGAAIRNNETLCNNIFPLRGPSIPLAQYARYVDQYWDTLNVLGRADGSRSRLLTYDIVLMLARFAMGASFSTDSKGGGKESNSRLLPFMLQMACHLLDQGGIGPKRVQAKSLSTYVSSSSSLSESPSKSSTSSSPQRFGASDDTAQFMMVQSLLLESLDDWQKHRQVLLQRSICHAYMQHKSGRTPLATSPLPSSPSTTRPSMDSTSTVSETRSMEAISEFNSTDKEQLFSVVRPMLTYCGLIDQLQRYFKSGGMRPKLMESSASQEGVSVHGGLESWEIRMRERLHDIKAMLGLSKELLEWLDDMQTAEDLQEAFDVMGDPLPSNSACEEFILSSISTIT